MSYLILSFTDYENNIEVLENTSTTQQCTIDSLTTVIDTLNHRLETFDIKLQFKQFRDEFKEVLDAIIFVESSDNDSAYHKGEDAVGCLQIRKCMVDDVNRILKRQGSYKLYSYQDRWNRNKSIDMFNIYVEHYNLNSAEEIARCWNGGPQGINNLHTVGYWNKVENKLEESYALR